MDSQKVFNDLVDNAFDFLNASIDQFDKSSKFSVINFQSAVELFFKGRLLKEHWSLILSEPEIADIENFVSGNFESVGIVGANTRLKKICSDGAGIAEMDCFIKLISHRNQMVHFFHPSQNKANTKDLEKVVSELCRAWYFLNRLLDQQWGSHFHTFSKKLKDVDSKMHKHRDFLKKKFTLVTNDIAAHRAKGLKIQKCPSCHLKAMVVLKEDKPVFERECLVCKLNDWGVVCDCPDCEKTQWITGDCWTKCHTKGCDHEFDAEEVADLLKYDTSAPGDVDTPCEAACVDCDDIDVVVKLENEEWLCTNCFVLYHDNDIGKCEWCSGYTANVSEDSYVLGCPACEGHSGWTKDD